MRTVSAVRYLFSLAGRSAPFVIPCVFFTSAASAAVYFLEWLLIPCVLACAESELSVTAAVVCGWTFLFAVVSIFKRYMQGIFEQERDRFRSHCATKLAEKALTLPYPTAVSSASLLKRASNALGRHIHAPVPGLFRSLSDGLFYLTGTVVFAALLLYTHPLLALTALLTAVAEAIVHRWVTKRGQRFAEREESLDAELHYVVQVAQSSSFAKEVRLFGMASWIRAIHDRAGTVLKGWIARRGKIYTVFSAVDVLMTLARNGIAYAVLIKAVLDGHLSMIGFLLCFTAVGCFTECVGNLLTLGFAFRGQCRALAAYRRYMETEAPASFCGTKTPPKTYGVSLVCRQVDFTLPGEKEAVLKGLDLCLRPHQKTAIIAEDERTLFAMYLLLCGICDPDNGQILLDETDVRKFDREALYSLYSAVPAWAGLANVTVRELLTGGDRCAKEETLWELLECVGLRQTVASLPLGLQTSLGREADEGGAVLSGGEVQRLLLARAFYKNGDIWVLDEPMSAVDPLAESMLYEECFRRIGDRTATVLSCRPTAARFCDRIIYVKNGTVAETGTHEELMCLKGDYARLYTLQSRYYREGRMPDASDIE